MQNWALKLRPQQIITGDCAVRQDSIEGFRAIYNEVLFVDMQPADGFMNHY